MTTIGKLSFVAFLAAMPAVAAAQPVGVDVGVNVSADVDADDAYDTTAPGDPVESVDVFYDQMEPYGTWVDEPDVGRVFIPDTENYVPYTVGHWQYTNLGFVWVSNEPYGWATSHYGRWAYSNNFNRWYWSPDTQWGPAWVEWRQTGADFGWAPLAPDVVVRAGWQAPIESWHYCGSDHILDVNVTRYYEPRDRVVFIHRDARPIVHYSTVSNVRVVVGPGRDVLREHRVVVRPVRVEARTIGRWTPAEAHAQVVHASEHREVFEANNQRRIEGNVRIHTAQTRVIETHPQIKVQINARVNVNANTNVNVNGRVDEHREVGRPQNRVEPARPENRGPETVHRNEPAPRPEQSRGEPNRVEPNRSEPNRTVPNNRPPVRQPEPQRPEPQRQEPRPEAQRPEQNRVEQRPQQPAPQQQHPQPAPQQQHQQPPQQHPQQPERREPEHKDEHH